eukprot:scaffold405154_cov13-Prasinocladus_malaysianus.AAC.1
MRLETASPAICKGLQSLFLYHKSRKKIKRFKSTSVGGFKDDGVGPLVCATQLMASADTSVRYRSKQRSILSSPKRHSYDEAAV